MRIWAGLLGVIFILAGCGGGSSSSAAAPGSPAPQDNGGGAPSSAGGSNAATYGEPKSTQIRPGAEIVANGSSCTGNFLYSPFAGEVYIGVAAHCFSPDSNRGIDPCETSNLPIGSAVSIENAVHSGQLVYSSWQAMQANKEIPGSAACQYNDFALVKIDSRDLANIHPAVVAIGGPKSLFTGLANVGDKVLAYGHSSLNFGSRDVEIKEGEIRAVQGGGWAYELVVDNPGVPGDSGGPVLTANGRALAVINVITAGFGSALVTNGVVNLDMALRYAIDGSFINRGTKILTWDDFRPAGDL
ncbi:MAG: hypothetical protein ACI9BO_000225 [Zhongshania sp.]|jgi:hypothetical protein